LPTTNDKTMAGAIAPLPAMAEAMNPPKIGIISLKPTTPTPLTALQNV